MKKKVISWGGAVLAIVALLISSACAGLLPPGFVVSDLTIEPSEAEVGETVTIEVTVRNFGTEEGTFYAPLLVDGVPVGVEEVTLGPGAEDTVSFTTTKNFGGTYTVNIGGETGTFTVTDSAMQKALKMLPVDWNIFGFFDVEEMRTDIGEPGLSALWETGEDWLEALSYYVLELPPGEWPATLATLDYLAMGVGDLGEETPSIAVIIGGTFILESIRSFITDIGFTEGSYNEVELWTMEIEGMPIAIALMSSDPVIIGGLVDAVKDCIDVINGDAESMFNNDGIRDVATDLVTALLLGVFDGTMPVPPLGLPEGVVQPEVIEGTAGFGLSKVDDTLKLELIGEIHHWSTWQALLMELLPEPPALPE